MNITNQNQQDPENYTADQNKQDTNNTGLSPNMSPVTYKKEEPLLVRAVVDNFSAFGVGSILYGLFFCFCIYRNFMAVTSVLLCAATIGYVLFCRYYTLILLLFAAPFLRYKGMGFFQILQRTFPDNYLLRRPIQLSV